MIFQNLLLLMDCWCMAPKSPGSSAEVLTMLGLHWSHYTQFHFFFPPLSVFLFFLHKQVAVYWAFSFLQTLTWPKHTDRRKSHEVSQWWAISSCCTFRVMVSNLPLRNFSRQHDLALCCTLLDYIRAHCLFLKGQNIPKRWQCYCSWSWQRKIVVNILFCVGCASFVISCRH